MKRRYKRDQHVRVLGIKTTLPDAIGFENRASFEGAWKIEGTNSDLSLGIVAADVLETTVFEEYLYGRGVHMCSKRECM